MLKKINLLLSIALLLSSTLVAQVTTSNISCVVKTSSGDGLAGASVTVTNSSNGEVFSSLTREGGRYELANIAPGGPYKIEVSFSGYEKIVRENIFLGLGETSQQDFILLNKTTDLKEVVITTARRSLESKGGTETTVGRDKMANLPTVGRNISDFLRFVPQAKITGDGGVSIAGQNNRYNSFYIDGAVNNDVFGLAASGTNGGQSGIAPISIDAIDQFQVVISPYDASLGNFTGGGINATTRSGSNVYEGSVYHFYRNENLSGKNPAGDKAAATKLPNFSNKTTGFRVGGPIIKNKLFFFLNGEIQRDERPQPFTGTYGGSSSATDIATLTNFLQTNYGYDPGGYLDNPELVEADRIAAKIDWKINAKNKLTASYRYNEGFRNNVSRSSVSTINFYNNGYAFPTTTQSGSLELNSRFKGNANNKLLLTFTEVEDDRGAISSPFPRGTIRDGLGSMIFGTEEFSTGNLLQQKNYALFDVFKFYKNKHSFSIGTDNELSTSLNIFIRQNYGSYTFADLNTFLTGGTAATYNRSYSLLDPGKSGDESVNAAAKFNTARIGFFASDEIKINDNFTLTVGVRADRTKFLTTPRTDNFFNDTAVAIISQYYDMKGARSGQISDPKWSLNPRAGFVYKIPEENLTIRGGVGFFTGRVPLVWPGGVYNNNGISVGGVARSNVAFRADPFGQYEASDFGITLPSPSGQVDLISKDFRLNKVFRTSLAVDKNLGKGWKATLEGVFTKNINEIDYKNISILPPTQKAVGIDDRNVYNLIGSFAAHIPLRPNGSTPYTGIYLLSNNDGKKGFSYSLTASIDKAFSKGWAFNANYSYGNSIVLNEGTSSQNNSQWRFMETVNGRNFQGLSNSDYDPGHRINAYISKKFSYLKGLMATTVSLVYNAQSGNTYSYVMNRGMVKDLDNFETNDLIYVPTTAEISSMVFLTNGALTAAQQRTAYDDFLNQDPYLRKIRGQYSERNGARLPFTNVVDLKLQQDFNLKLGAKVYQLQLTYDVFNFTNMLNRDWGKVYFVANDQVNILDFTGFVSNANLTPQYRFTPVTRTKNLLTLSDGVFNSSRWTSQLGVRLSF
ncbi:MAG: carboxypeptidase regulatory-like domain-containing protein [Chitinophagaceae bacterium]|nr:carboxypeptidase regulatory-like domain-containing protein [Chitinophagaceae bacterium]